MGSILGQGTKIPQATWYGWGGGGWGLGKGEESRVSIGINFSDQLPILDLRRANVQLHSLALRIYSIEIAPLCILSQNKAT